MKRDLLFILIAIIVGAGISIFLQAPQDDVLFNGDEQYPAQAEAQPVQAPKREIVYRNLRRSRPSGYDQVTDPIDSLASYRQIYDEEALEEITAESEVEADVPGEPTAKPKIKREEIELSWDELFDQWKILFVDNVTRKTGLMDALSISPCAISLIYNDGTTKTINNVSDLSVAIRDEEILLMTTDKKMALNYLTNKEAFGKGTQVLVDYCKSYRP